MAEIIATELIKVVFQKLGEETLKRFVRSHGIQSEIKKLGKTLSKIQDLLNDASEKENTRKDVKEWLTNLQHLAYDIDDVLDGLATDAMHHQLTEATTSKVRKFIPTCCTDFSLTNRLHPKLDSIATKLQDLEKEKVDLGLNIVKDEKPKNMSRINETSLPDVSSRIIGRQGDIEKFLQKLLGDHDEPSTETFSIVPIVGLGGVGKTTLARMLYNEPQVKDHFELMAWVCISNDFDIFKISKTIFQDVARENKEFINLNQLQLALTEQLKEKRFLVVLDDVWSENVVEWQNLVKPFHSGAPGSKIVVTTRKERLLLMLGFDHVDHLESLSHDDAMSLFALHALGVDNFNSHPTLKTHGDGIVRKCGGLPLALSALGRLLRAKTNEEDWEDVLNNEIWDLDNVDEIVPALRLSYHDLPAHLKQLFAYCSLFPKDFVFDKEDLVLLWMAEGYLNQSTISTSPERLGNDYFNKLLSRSFFQHAPNQESQFVMHDLMNDLATFVAGKSFLRFDNHMKMKNEVLEKYRHMSFSRERRVGYQRFEAFKSAKSLRSLIAVHVGVQQSWEHFYLSNKILVDLLPELLLLRVLNLSCFDISEVPKSIGRMKHLRYLNLSQTKIEELPESVGNLYNLETLIVFGCDELRKLPSSFLMLKGLRHFDIRDTPLLKKMPLGIGELRNLQTLTKIIVEGDGGFELTELKELHNLHGHISIEGLDKVREAFHARDANLSQKRLTELELKWGNVVVSSRDDTLDKEVLNMLKPRSDELKRLKIVRYGGKEFPNWIGDPLFFQLTHVTISCSNCTFLPPLWKLPSLKELYIEGVNEVKVAGSELLGTGVSFRKLEVLSFINMYGWPEWLTKSGVVDHVVFPRLEELRIEDCPCLVEVSLQKLPSLRVLYIIRCNDEALRCTVRAASSVTKLEINNIFGLVDEVWRDVMKYLEAIEEIKIGCCYEIRYLWESEAEANKVLINLRKLEVSCCSKLVRLGEKEEDCGSNFLSSLRMLHVEHCDSMEHCSYPNNIEDLRISSCNSLTSVSSFPKATGGGQKLKSLVIENCKKLMENEFGEEKLINNNTSSMHMLEFVMICRWPNLKYITELSYSIHLTALIIGDCSGMESFPDLQLSKLASLIRMSIIKCRGMDASFPRGLWPPKLSYLEIGELKKPMSEWGPQNFPTSLVELWLYGEGGDVSSSQLCEILPSSLTCLFMYDFEKLESFSMGLGHLTSLIYLQISNFQEMIHLSTGLQHLTSLKHLTIFKCPKIEDLPEMLLPALLSLDITGCPILEERTSKKGSYYSRISHIPHIYITKLISIPSAMITNSQWLEKQ